MRQPHPFRSALSRAPKIIKGTLLTTLIVSFFSLVSNALFTKVFNLPSPQHLFSLSTWGVHKFFIWQFISYLFIQPISEGISLGSILRLFFDLYLLYMIGTAIVQTRGKKHFLGLYFGGALFVGIIAYFSLLLSGSPLPFAGASPAIYILLIAFVFLTPHARIMLFLMIPVQAKWLVFGLIGVNLFLDFSNGHFLSFFTTGAALIYGYLYPILSWDILSPFYRLHPFEKKAIYWKRRLFNQFSLTLREK